MSENPGNTAGAKVKRTVVLGKGELAIAAARYFVASPPHELVAVVPVTPEPTFVASLTDWATKAGVRVVASGHYRDLLAPEAEPIDLAISIFYDKIIRADFIDHCGRILNIHNSALPRYRGVRPINWALKNGEREHGVTLHEITPGVDDGPIVAQVRFPIWPDHDEVADVYQRCLAFGQTLFEQTMPILDRVVAVAQDHDAATFYHSRDNHLLGDRATLTRADAGAADKGR
jgi:methionyl-tRNA formyltransferase